MGSNLKTTSRLITTLLCSLCIGTIAVAANTDITTIVEGKIVLPADFVLPSTALTYIQLDSGKRQTTPPSQDGSFQFQNIPAGQHLVGVEALGFIFPTVLVTIDSDSMKIKAIVADIPGANGNVIPYPISFYPLGKVSYFEKRAPFSLMAWLKTPYGIMIGMTLFSLVVMPYLKVDEEEYREMVQEKDKVVGSIMGRPEDKKKN